MGSHPRSSRRRTGVASRILAVIVALCLGMCSVASLSVKTQKGIQCPTAAVQAVVVAKRDCCDRIVGYVVRKPRLGEKGFKQCQCAEKHAGQNHDFTGTSVFSVEMMPGKGFDLILPDRLPETFTEPTLDVRLCAVALPPSIRPPLA